MNRLIGCGLLLCLAGIGRAALDMHVEEAPDTLSGGLWGLTEKLGEYGISVDAGITNIYQVNAKGGRSTGRHRGRYTGSYDLELAADLERYFGIPDSLIFIHLEGNWPDENVDDVSVGSYFGVNADAGEHRSLDVTELYYQQDFWDRTLSVRVGKIDLTGGFECSGCPVSFDGNRYANDETSQFLNGALVNNPTIPFPDYSLAVIVYWNPTDIFYASLGAADSQGDRRETGFNTAFHDEDYFLYIAETGITPELSGLRGAYRFGVWYRPEPKSAGEGERLYRDDTGFYISADQLVYRESEEDEQGLGAFFRYGFAHERSNDLEHFVSFGVQYEGLFEGRDEDVLGIGYAHGAFSDRANNIYTDDFESVVEAYYNIKATRWMRVSPSVQYVANPGGDEAVDDALVLGLRAQITF
jgi:porin